MQGRLPLHLHRGQHATFRARIPQQLSQGDVDTWQWYLACGMTPQKSTIVQSHVPDYAQLGMALTKTSNRRLSRMTPVKDKSARYRSNINAGLY